MHVVNGSMGHSMVRSMGHARVYVCVYAGALGCVRMYERDMLEVAWVCRALLPCSMGIGSTIHHDFSIDSRIYVSRGWGVGNGGT